jgi:glycerophosphoryl diester phosphodiesterase
MTYRMRSLPALLILLVLLFNVSIGRADETKYNALAFATRDQFPQILAHRGASGYIPEHSLQAYETAMNLQTDYVEPDLCLTKDGVFVALHDVLLDDTTNVAELPEFASYKSTKVVDGVSLTGYFVSDFTHAETQKLSLKQRLSFRTQIYNGFFTIPTLQQITALALDNFNSTQRLVGLYIELKHPSFFKSLGFDMASMLLRELSDAGYAVDLSAPSDLKRVLPLVIQCFDAPTLRALRPITSIPLVQLLDPPTPAQLHDGSYWSGQTLKEIATYANAVGPEKTYFSTLPLSDGQTAVQSAQEAGLAMHPWTFRAEAQYVGKQFTSFAEEQAYFFFCLGVAGVFTEFPDQTRQVLQGAKVCPAPTQI